MSIEVLMNVESLYLHTLHGFLSKPAHEKTEKIYIFKNIKNAFFLVIRQKMYFFLIHVHFWRYGFENQEIR